MSSFGFVGIVEDCDDIFVDEYLEDKVFELEARIEALELILEQFKELLLNRLVTERCWKPLPLFEGV